MTSFKRIFAVVASVAGLSAQLRSLPEPIRLGSSFLLSGRVFILQSDDDRGLTAREWIPGSRTYAPARILANEQFGTLHPLAISAYRDDAAVMLASVRGIGCALWQVRCTGRAQLTLLRITRFVQDLQSMHTINVLDGDGFLLSGESGAMLLRKDHVCRWKFAVGRFDMPASHVAVKRNEVLVAKEGLQWYRMPSRGCPSRPEMLIAGARVAGVAPFDSGWLILLNRAGGQALVALDHKLRSRWLIQLRPNTWLLTAAGSRAVAWAPGGPTAYSISDDKILELAVSGDSEPVDLVSAASPVVIFATRTGLVNPRVLRVVQPHSAFMLPGTSTPMTLVEASIAAAVAIIAVTGLVFVIARTRTVRGRSV